MTLKNSEKLIFNRDKSIDIAKGIGILLVILGHVPTVPTELKKIIYSFHMPLFFFVSGYLYNIAKYNSLKLREFIITRIKKFIVPYFKIGLICFALFGVIYPLVTEGYNKAYIIQCIRYLVGLFYSKGLPKWMAWSCPLWFLTCIFCTEVIFYLAIKYSKKPIITFAILGTVGFVYTLATTFALPWNIDVALTAVCFMYIGSLCRKYNLITKLYDIKWIFILFIILSLSIILNVKIDFNLRNYGNILLTYLSGTSGSILTLEFSRMIKHNKLLEFNGVNSLYMMGFTYSILNIVTITDKQVSILDNFIVNFIIQAILLGVLVMFIVKIKKIYIKKIN